MIERLISSEEASGLLGVTSKSLANSRYTGTGINIPYIKLGKIVRYKESDIQAYIEANTYSHSKVKIKEDVL
jgi:predicted DNA-binding transcriptional regulator AlpA